jgi:hypothetical protein
MRRRRARNVVPDPDRWTWDVQHNLYGLGVAITREVLDDNLYRQTMQNAQQQAQAYLGQMQNGLAAQAYQALGQQQQALGQDQGLGQLALQQAALRDLLLPGLMGIIGRYPDIPREWPAVFGTVHPRIDAETAARSKERARGLLKSLLTPEQWAELEARGAITEKIEGNEFKLTLGAHTMIEARKPRLVGGVSEKWCVAPDPYADGNDFMPDEDKMIGQLLHLRAGPDKVRAMSNVFLGGDSGYRYGYLNPRAVWGVAR